jgi:hypothetical protein
MKKFEYLKVLNSPFRIPKLKFYLGKIALGTPYFFPRRWVPCTKQDATKSATERFDRLVKVRKRKNDKKLPTQKMWMEFYNSSLKSRKPVPKKFGWDFVSLGYKYKWDEPRFEWSPMFSFVFWKYQFAITVSVPHTSHYWESWIYYHNETDKNLSKKERLELTKKGFPNTWTSHHNGEKTTTNYYDLIIKKKYK